MSDIYTQTDTAAPLGVIQACAPVAPAGDADAVEASIGGTAGVTALACAVANASSELCFATELNIADDTSLDSGTLTFRLNVSTSQADLTLEEIYVCRVASDGTSQETLGSVTGLGTDISAGGVFSQNISLSAASAHNAGDKVYITVIVANAHSHTSRTIEVLPDQDVDTPFVAAAGAVEGGSASTVGVVTAGGGTKVASGGSAVVTDVLASGSGQKTASGGSSASVGVTAVGGGEVVVGASGGAASTVDVTAQGSGTKLARAPPTDATVGVTSAGAGAKLADGGAGAAVDVVQAGSGEKVAASGSGTVVDITSSGAGQKVASGGSASAVDVVAVGGGNEAGVVSGGSDALVDIAPAGAGEKSAQSGAAATVGVTAEGAGAKVAQDGAGSAVDVTAAGAGERLASGGSVASVDVLAVGAGEKPGAVTLSPTQVVGVKVPVRTLGARTRKTIIAARKLSGQ